MCAESTMVISIRNTAFLENMAKGEYYGGEGGAIYSPGGSPQMELYGCEFRGNNASESGGAVFYSATGSVLVNSTNFVTNWAGNGGGAVRATGGVGLVSLGIWGVCKKILWDVFMYMFVCVLSFSV